MSSCLDAVVLSACADADNDFLHRSIGADSEDKAGAYVIVSQSRCQVQSPIGVVNQSRPMEYLRRYLSQVVVARSLARSLCVTDVGGVTMPIGLSECIWPRSLGVFTGSCCVSLYVFLLQSWLMAQIASYQPLCAAACRIDYPRRRAVRSSPPMLFAHLAGCVSGNQREDAAR